MESEDPDHTDISDFIVHTYMYALRPFMCVEEKVKTQIRLLPQGVSTHFDRGILCSLTGSLDIVVYLQNKLTLIRLRSGQV